MRTINIGQKDPLISRAWRWFRTIQIAALLMFGLVSAISSAANSRLYPPTKDEAGASRAAQVVHVATREEILAFHDNLKPLLASGLQQLRSKGRKRCHGPRLLLPRSYRASEHDVVLCSPRRASGHR